MTPGPDDRGWFHVIVTAYGAWLPGDPRGFRTRHHREHVEGDYKNPPPPGLYDGLFARSKGLLKQGPVWFPPFWRPVIGGGLRDRLEQEGAQVLCVAVGWQHAHALAKMPPPPIPRYWVGLAKRHVTFRLHDLGWRGEVWGKRGKNVPVRDRKHQLNVFRYILRHAEQGAWVWDFRTRAGQPGQDGRDGQAPG
jgi:hypothetical protein